MELHDDVIRLIIAVDPVVFLGVSKQSRAAALAAITAAVTVQMPGRVMYKGKLYVVSDSHRCANFDVQVLTDYFHSLCDINPAPDYPCIWCRLHTHGPAGTWLSGKTSRAVSIHYSEVIQIIIAAARNHRNLPTGFGAEI